jgi:hypothetical protein
MFGGDATHAAPALIQGALALARAAFVVFAWRQRHIPLCNNNFMYDIQTWQLLIR